VSYLGKSNEEYRRIADTSNLTEADYRRLANEAIRKAVVLSNAPYQEGGTPCTYAYLARLEELHNEALDMTILANMKITLPTNPRGPLKLHPNGHGFVVTCNW